MNFEQLLLETESSAIKIESTRHLVKNGVSLLTDGVSVVPSDVGEIEEQWNAMLLMNAQPYLAENIEINADRSSSLAMNIRKLFDNFTMVTLVRGRETYVVIMTRHSSEYMKLEDTNIVTAKTFSNRSTASKFIDKLKMSGFEEENFTSTIPKSIHVAVREVKARVPLIAVLVFLWAINPPAIFAAMFSFLIRGAWALLKYIFVRLPMNQFDRMNEEIQEALSTLNMG